MQSPAPDYSMDAIADGSADARVLRRLFGLVLPFLPQLVAITLILLGISGLTMLIPRITGDIIDSAIDPHLSQRLNSIALILLGLICALSVLRYVSSYWLSKVGAHFLYDLRERIFGNLLTLSAGFFQRRQVGELNARVITNLEEIQNIITSDVLIGMQAVVRLTGVIVILFALNIQLTIVALLVSAPTLLVSLLYGKHLERAYLLKNDALSESSGAVQEALAGISTVQAFNQERQEASRYRRLLDRLLFRQLRHAKLRSSYAALADLFALSAIAVVIWFGGRLILTGALTVGELTSCMMYMLIFATSIEDVSRLFSSIQELTGISRRFFQILDEVPQIRNQGTLVADATTDLTLSFDAVSFAYPPNSNDKVIDSLSIEIRAGEVVALVGPSGAGKSTLFKLLMRFYDADSGVIRVGGQPLASYELSSLRDLFGLVSQEIFLFSGTILENIRYGNAAATADEVRAALDAVGASDFVSAFANGLEEQVGVGGSRLSGGQKQRLGLARVYLKNPKILLLDEATSALDSESESQVQLGLQQLKRGRTTIVIAHRLSTVRESDRILVVENGRIVASGDHAHLQEHSSLYRKYWQWQSNGAGAVPQDSLTQC